MWKMCIVLLVLTLVTATLSSQSESLTESMTEEQLEEYNRNKLTVDVGIGISSDFVGIHSYRKWTGRQGFKRLSEAQFYEIAGYPEQAEKAANYRTTGWVLAVGGGALAVGGGVLMMLSLNVDYDDPDYSTKFNRRLYGGAALCLGGAIPFWIGRNRLQKNWSSVEQAQMVADEYNRKLAEKIRSRGTSRDDQTASYTWEGLPSLFPANFASP